MQRAAASIDWRTMPPGPATLPDGRPHRELIPCGRGGSWLGEGRTWCCRLSRRARGSPARVGGGVRRYPPPALAPAGGDVLLALAGQVGERALPSRMYRSVLAGRAAAVSGSMISSTCRASRGARDAPTLASRRFRKSVLLQRHPSSDCRTFVRQRQLVRLVTLCCVSRSCSSSGRPPPRTVRPGCRVRNDCAPKRVTISPEPWRPYDPCVALTAVVRNCRAGALIA